MFPVYRTALLAGSLVALAPGPASAQGACQETCPNALTNPGGAAACVARVASCTTKLALYHTYMNQLSAGVVKAGLKPLYIQILLPHYPTVGLNAWRFGWANRQPLNNTTTDCTNTYFNLNPTYANSLALGYLSRDDEFRLLFNGMTRVALCVSAGEIDRYGGLWCE